MVRCARTTVRLRVDPGMPASTPPFSGAVDPAAPPRLAVRVGITGHRRLDDAQIPAIRDAIERVLGVVASHAEAIRSARASGFDQRRPPLLRALSPLAEGADRIMAHAALGRGWDLQCPLPFQRGEYENDFASAESRSEFRAMLGRASAVLECDGRREQADHAYASVGLVLLNQVDLLVAVWNGEPARGLGGTGDVVEHAKRQHVPVAWVHSRDGTVTLVDGTGAAGGASWEEGIRACMNRAMVLGGRDPGAPLSPEAQAERDRFEDAIRVPRDRASLLGWVFRTFMRVLSWPPAPSVAPGVDVDARATLPSPFVPHYERANHAAIRYAGIDRGGVLVNYFLGVVAVLCALLSVPLSRVEDPAPGWMLALLVVAELLALASMAALYAVARATRAKLRALDCRLYAEQLRQMEFLWPLGRTAPEVQPMAHARFGDPRSTAMAWRFRAVVREVGLPGGAMDAGMLAAALGSIRDSWIGGPGGQLAYHQALARRIARVDHRLHAFAWTLFVATFLCCLGHFAAHGNPRVELWLIVATVAFPAVGAAAHAVTSQFEFRRLRERSESMQQALSDSLDALRKVGAAGQPVTSQAIAEAVQSASHAMMNEVMDWRILSSKPPTEPA